MRELVLSASIKLLKRKATAITPASSIMAKAPRMTIPRPVMPRAADTFSDIDREAQVGSSGR